MMFNLTQTKNWIGFYYSGVDMAISEDHVTVQKAFKYLSDKYLSEKHQSSFSISNLFEQEFNCKFVETTPYNWSIEFINEVDETIFLLRWS